MRYFLYFMWSGDRPKAILFSNNVNLYCIVVGCPLVLADHSPFFSIDLQIVVKVKFTVSGSNVVPVVAIFENHQTENYFIIMTVLKFFLLDHEKEVRYNRGGVRIEHFWVMGCFLGLGIYI